VRRDLLIGIGNPLRGDDGVGPRLVEELVDADAERRIVHQLTPELVLAVAEAPRVLFVDAWANPDRPEPWIEGLRPPLGGEPTPEALCPGGHGWSPRSLVALAGWLYGWRGEAALLRVPAYVFSHGTTFSEALGQSLPLVRALLRRWLAGDGSE
jgi:hydrogenase maturation protease